eukprot:1194592-Prorocentrum_minimum.AAC.16
MENVPLIKNILNTNVTANTEDNPVAISFTNWFLCEVSKLVGTNSYCEGKVIERLINEEDISQIFEKLHNGMIRLLNRLDDDDNFIQEVFYQSVFQKRGIRKSYAYRDIFTIERLMDNTQS